MLHSTPPSLNHLKVFRCLAYSSTLHNNRTKFAPRARKSIFLGYWEGTKGYLLYDPLTHEFYVSRNVTFHETIFPFASPPPENNSVSINPNTNTIDTFDILTDIPPSLTSPNEPTSPPSLHNLPPPTHDITSSPSPHQLPPSPHDIISPTSPPVPTRKSNRLTKPPAYLSEYHCNLLSSMLPAYNPGNSPYPLSSVLSYDKCSPCHKQFCLSISSLTEPKTYKQACKFDCWNLAMKSELDALVSTNTWSVVDLPTGTKKPKRLTSVVWNHFERIRKADICYAVCLHCNKRLSGSSNSGTTYLKNHLMRCLKRSNFDVSQLLTVKRRKKDNTVSLANISFDEGFKVFVKNLQPLFEFLPNSNVEISCIEIYRREKEKVNEMINKLCGRINLSIEMWSSAENTSFLCLSAHYIDEKWTLQKKILNFLTLDSSYTEDLLPEVIIKCLDEWDIDCKLFALTLDDCSVDDDITLRIKERVSEKRPFLSTRQILDVRFAAHLIISIVQDAMDALHELIHLQQHLLNHLPLELLEYHPLLWKSKLQIPERHSSNSKTS
ncbi:hypothetical protein KIW84_034004 [Lathyrus oleraceus]|uniref:BED-type domain-containing protein n=1 Tax=Pisum sativum TaxID=3888 RepID=A0A9D4XZ60_PEA|nr:hypothetical protein KIW84_034004 [Pisum sativum]